MYIYIYPLVICYTAIENGPVEIVNLPFKISLVAIEHEKIHFATSWSSQPAAVAACSRR